MAKKTSLTITARYLATALDEVVFQTGSPARTAAPMAPELTSKCMRTAMNGGGLSNGYRMLPGSFRRLLPWHQRIGEVPIPVHAARHDWSLQFHDACFGCFRAGGNEPIAHQGVALNRLSFERQFCAARQWIQFADCIFFFWSKTLRANWQYLAVF